MNTCLLLQTMVAAGTNRLRVLRKAAGGRGHRALAGLLLGMAGARPSHAQDLVVRIDGKLVEARGVAVMGTQLAYKNWADPDGPTTMLSTDYVRCVQYQNGTRQDFTTTVPARVGPALAAKAACLGRNIVSIRPLDLFLTDLALTYERLLGADSRVGVKVPLTLKLHRQPAESGHYWAYYPVNKIFSTGLELNFYTGPPARFRYFFGPALQYGRFRSRSGEESFQVYIFFFDLGEAYRYEEAVGEHFAVLFNNGVWYQVGKRCVFTGEGGMGWQNKALDKNHRNLDTENLAGSSFKVAVNFGFGYQF